jgi:hypothetical protein
VAKDPQIYPQGILISHQKYIVPSDIWVGNAVNGTYAMTWFFNIEGEFGTFIDIRLEVRIYWHSYT